MFHITTDSRKIYYEVQGNLASETTLVLLNGLSQSTIAWGLTTPFLAAYKIVVLDFIFQGQSDKTGEALTFDEHAAGVKSLLDELKIKKVIPVGISYGSLVAQHFCINYPHITERCVLLSTFAHKTPYFNAIDLSWRRALDTGGYDLMLDVMLPFVLSEKYFASPLIPIDLMKNARKGVNEDAASLKKLMQATFERDDYRSQLKEIKCPTLVVHGEYDMLLPVHMGREVANNIVNSKFVVVPYGHTLNLECANDVATMIDEFVKE